MYLTLKALHIIAVIAWMAGMLYLPRLFVYHSDLKKGSAASELLKVMERRLLKFIMNPAMIVTFALGFWIILQSPEYYMKEGWLHIKLTLVFIMAGLHGYFAKTVRIFAADQNQKSAKFFRIINEAPTVLMIAIVFLAILKQP